MTHTANSLAGPDLSRRAVDYLRVLCDEYPQYPTVALFRCWELALLSSLQMQPPILDLGCGDGRVLQRLSRDGWGWGTGRQVFGLDLDGGSVAVAARREAFAGAVVGDARELPFDAACFGGATSVCVLEHIPEVERALREVARVLKPGARLAFSVPTPLFLDAASHSHPEAPEQYAREVAERTELHTVWTHQEWGERVRESGLAVREVVGFMPPGAAGAWFEANDWVVAPIRGRGLVYRAAGPGLRRFGLGRALSGYWHRRLRRWAAEGVSASLDEACAVLVVAERV